MSNNVDFNNRLFNLLKGFMISVVVFVSLKLNAVVSEICESYEIYESYVS